MFDTIIKLLSDDYGPAVVGFFQARLGLPVGGPFQIVSGSLPRTTVEADRVFRVDRPGPMLIHTEWESSSHLGRPDRFLEYNDLLTRHTGLPVRTVVVLLRPQATSSDLTGRLTRTLPTGEEYLDFRYVVLRLWEIPPAVFLTDPGLTPFAPLGAVTEAGLPALAREMEARWAGLESKEAGGLLAATEVLMGLRYSDLLIEGLFGEVPTMEESVIYQKIFAKGEARGELRHARRTLLRAGTTRFGPPPTDITARIDQISDPDHLDRMFDAVGLAADWASVLATE